jgi:predicted transposase/invertase (TIGR01784 family)
MLTEKSDKEYILTDHLIIHYLEIDKIKDQNLKIHLRKWIEYFNKEGKEDMTILLKGDPIIHKAHNAYAKFTGDDNLKEMYEAREKWKLDYQSGLQEAEEKGIEQGIEKGIEQGIKKGIKEGIKEGDYQRALKDAQKMLEKGLDINLIAEITGLDVKEIKKK